MTHFQVTQGSEKNTRDTGNEDMTRPNARDAANTVLRGKYHIFTEDLNKVSFHLESLENEEQTKPKERKKQ